MNHIYPPEDRDTAYCGHISKRRLPAVEGAVLCEICETASDDRGLALYWRTATGRRLVRGKKELA